MKKKRWKSVFAGALTAAMVCNMGLASMAWAEPEEDAGTSLLADFSFDDEMMHWQEVMQRHPEITH